MGELRFDDRVVVVTGAGRGMGRWHVLQFAERGAKLVVSDAGVRLLGTGGDPGPANQVADLVRDAGGEAVAYAANLEDEGAARGVVRCAIETYGRVDVVVHNAGITLGGLAFADEQLERMDKLAAINIRAAYALVQEAWPHMVAQRYGRVLVVSSTAVYGMPMSVPYCTAKAAHIGFVRALALAGAPYGVRVNALGPSAATRMSENLSESPFRTWFLDAMRPELVSPVVLAVTHEDCSVSGEFFVAGGGRVARMALAETAGYVNTSLSPEDVLGHMTEVLSVERLSFPGDTSESLKLTAAALGADLDALGALTDAAPPGRAGD